MPRNLARRDILLPVVRRYIYIAFGVIWAAFFRFPSLFLFVDPPLPAIRTWCGNGAGMVREWCGEWCGDGAGMVR